MSYTLTPGTQNDKLGAQGGESRFIFMPVITVALMGFFAFGGGPMTAPETTPAALTSVEAAPAVIALAEAPEMTPASDSQVYTVKLTSYNAVPEQTDANPHITASGASSNPEVVAARSVDLAAALPFGTIVAIEREDADTGKCHFGAVRHLVGYRVIADSMHSRKREQIDILLDQNDTVLVNGAETNPSVALGICSGATVRVIGKIAVNEIPATQEELRMIVEGDALALR